nr:hypothetical protein [Euzebyales bacterium]
MPARLCARAVTVLVTAGLLVASLAGPAAAHGRGSDATNYRSTVTRQPELPGVSWRMYGGDEYLSVTNTSDVELVVQGYAEEPYLRVGPDGVFVNRASPATYQNADRYGESPVPEEGVDASLPPRWAKVSGGGSYAWHDHRVHWMSRNLPPQVTDPGRTTLVNEWTVPFSVGRRAYTVSGTLEWVPAPSPLPWLAVAVVVTLPALLGLRSGGKGDWRHRLARPAAAVLGVVALVNLTHLVDDLFAVPLPAATKALAAAQTAMFIAIALFGALRGWQGRDGSFTALGVGAGALLVGQGLLYVSVLGTSQSASVFPDALARTAVALSLVQAVTVGAVAVAGNRRLAAEAAPAEPDPEAAPVT